MRYAKAITAFIVTILTLVIGEEATNEINIDTMATIISALLVSLGVYGVPNEGTH